jgi:hypothetical protein
MNPIDRLRQYFGSPDSKRHSLSDRELPKVLLPPQLKELYLEGIHDIGHAYRVLLLVNELAALEKLDKRQWQWLQFCAIFHDIGRIDNGADCLHGKRTVLILKHNDFWGLPDFNNLTIHFIIANHCVDDSRFNKALNSYNIDDKKEATYLLRLFKDADNLDRFRIGDFDPAYLRNKSSRNLVRKAAQLYYSDVGHEEVEKELQDAFMSLGAET